MSADKLWNFVCTVRELSTPPPPIIHNNNGFLLLLLPRSLNQFLIRFLLFQDIISLYSNDCTYICTIDNTRGPRLRGRLFPLVEKKAGPCPGKCGSHIRNSMPTSTSSGCIPGNLDHQCLALHVHSVKVSRQESLDPHFNLSRQPSSRIDCFCKFASVWSILYHYILAISTYLAPKLKREGRIA